MNKKINNKYFFFPDKYIYELQIFKWKEINKFKDSSFSVKIFDAARRRLGSAGDWKAL